MYIEVIHEDILLQNNPTTQYVVVFPKHQYVTERSSVLIMRGKRVSFPPGSSLVSQPSPDQLALRFRPNFIVSGDLEPFAEEMWTHIEMGDHTFQVCDPCV